MAEQNGNISIPDVEDTSLENRREMGTPWGGKFILTLPFIHYKPHVGDALHGFVLSAAIGVGLAPLMMNFFGLTYYEAIAFAIIQSLWIFVANWFMGEPMLSGWLTPLLPLTMVFVGGFSPGIEATHAVMALVILVSVVTIVFGLTGLGKFMINRTPLALKAGILLGVAFAGMSERLGTTYTEQPISAITATIVAMVFMYAPFVRNNLGKSKVLKTLSVMSLAVAILVSGIVGFISKEIIWEENIFQHGLFFIPPFMDLIEKMNPFFIGLPPLEMFVKVIPLTLAAYIIMYSDLITGMELVKDAQKTRPQKIAAVFDPVRTHISVALRNIGHLLTAGPFIGLHGPLWTGGQVFLCERYKLDPGVKNLPSIASNFYMLGWIPLFVLPIVLFFQPLTSIILTLTIVLTCFACGYVAMQLAPTTTEKGLATLIGAIIATRGPLVGLISGVLIVLLILGFKAFRNQKSNTI